MTIITLLFIVWGVNEIRLTWLLHRWCNEGEALVFRGYALSRETYQARGLTALADCIDRYDAHLRERDRWLARRPV